MHSHQTPPLLLCVSMFPALRVSPKLSQKYQHIHFELTYSSVTSTNNGELIMMNHLCHSHWFILLHSLLFPENKTREREGGGARGLCQQWRKERETTKWVNKGFKGIIHTTCNYTLFTLSESKNWEIKSSIWCVCLC